MISLRSSAFAANAPIPRKYTGDGDDVSPPLQWSDLPSAASELALIVDDPDAPTPQPWVHWVIYKIPVDRSGLDEGVPTDARTQQGLLQGLNSWPNGIGYRGPEPPRGHGVHHYHFTLYALDAKLNVQEGLSAAELRKAMAGHILAQAELIGTYER
jgi:hypothetical protein